MSSILPDRQETMTHGLLVTSIKETVLMLVKAYPDKAWLISSLCRKIFAGQEIRDSHKRALRDVLSKQQLPNGWIYHPLRYQELDGILYNINSMESRRQSDHFVLGSTQKRKYNQLLKEEIDLERKSFEPTATYDLDHNQSRETENNSTSRTKDRDQKSISLEKVDSLLRKIDDI
jgi:hypothetical protein